MKKNSIIIILATVVIAIVLGVTQSKKNVKLQTTEEIQAMLTSIYSKAKVDLPELETMDMPVSDEMQLQSFTGLQSNENIEILVVSTPLINAQAYSLAVLKVDEKANIEQIKQNIYDNIDMRKWICVSAEKLYITNYDNIIFVIMSSQDVAKPIYEEIASVKYKEGEEFKKYVGNNVGKELEKSDTSIDDFSIPEAETIN